MSSFRRAPLRGTYLQLHPACPSQRVATMTCTRPPLYNQLDYAVHSNGSPRVLLLCPPELRGLASTGRRGREPQF